MIKLKIISSLLILLLIGGKAFATGQVKKAPPQKHTSTHKTVAKKKVVKHKVTSTAVAVAVKPLADEQLNFIENDFALRAFYEKLSLLEQGKVKQVSIIHIGDSHIQADFLTGTLRDSLQSKYGSAGRGLYFPYRTAGTNGPDLVKDNGSEANWRMKRCAFPNQPMPIGLMGITLEVAQNAYIDIYVRETDAASLFDELRIFSDGEDKLKLSVSSIDGSASYTAKETSTAKTKQVSEYGLGDFQSSVRINLSPLAHDTNTAAHLYGVQLNNTKAHGIQYNMIGVNGAKYSDYNAARYFFSQLGQVPADLIIISLGTNEALSLTYSADSMYMALDQFYRKLRQVQGSCSILFTAPPDTYYQHTNPNPHTAEIVDIERRYAIAHDCAFWDFYTIMGGLGSVTNWYKQGYGNKDLVHFLRLGYQKQGQLLYKALMSAYIQNKK